MGCCEPRKVQLGNAHYLPSGIKVQDDVRTLAGKCSRSIKHGFSREANPGRYSKYLPRERIRGRVVFRGSKAYEATVTRGHRPNQLDVLAQN